MTALKRIWAGWDEFFFAPASPVPIAMFRIVFGTIILAMYSIRAMDWKFYFTDAGMVPANHALDILPEYYQPSFGFFPHSDGATLAVQVALLLAIAALTLGFRARWAGIVAFLTHVALVQRNYACCYGADFVATFLFFSLALADSGRVLSVESWWRRRKGLKLAPESEVSALFTSVGVRLLQIQMCIIYAYTGMEKLKGGPWWDGTAVWAVIGNPQLLMIDLSWLKHFPMAIAAMTFSTLVFEIYFAPLVWIKPIRKWVLLIGLGLHAGIAVTIGLFFFSSVMASSYCVFIEEGDWRIWLSRIGVSV